MLDINSGNGVEVLLDSNDDVIVDVVDLAEYFSSEVDNKTDNMSCWDSISK